MAGTRTRGKTRRGRTRGDTGVVGDDGKPWSEGGETLRVQPPTVVSLSAAQRARVVAGLAECFAALLARDTRAAS